MVFCYNNGTFTKGVNMKRLALVAALALTVSTQALAWGDREQGILTGIAGYWLYQKLDQAGKPQGAPQAVPNYPPPPAVVYGNPNPYGVQPNPYLQRHPPTCRMESLFNGAGHFIGQYRMCD
jgi:hypothetical protein